MYTQYQGPGLIAGTRASSRGHPIAVARVASAACLYGYRFCFVISPRANQFITRWGEKLAISEEVYGGGCEGIIDSQHERKVGPFVRGRVGFG